MVVVLHSANANRGESPNIRLLPEICPALDCSYRNMGGAVAEASEATNANQCYLQMKRMMSQMKKMEVQI